jgi:lipoate-protein ligase A
MPPTGKRAFRFILSGANDGATNMAIDEAVMAGIREGSSTPVLRLYTWNPPTISLGYFQSAGDIDFAACGSDGIGVVRRITGGRAVLHSDEITYSVLFGEEDFTPFRMKEIFLFIAQCLVDSLRILGIDSKIAQKTKGSLKSPNCFASPAQYEIESVQQGKLIGSAQVIKDGVVLQHGAIPLTGSYREISKYLRGDGSFKNASSLSQVSPAGGCEDGIVESLREGFARHIPIEDGALNEREAVLTKELAASKYAHRDWIFRK